MAPNGTPSRQQQRWRWARWAVAVLIVGAVAGFSAFWLVTGENPSCIATTKTWTNTRARAGANSISTGVRRVCGLPDTSDYLYVLALAGLFLLPDIQYLKFGGFEFRQLSDKVAEQTKEVANQTKQIDNFKNELKNELKSVVQTSQAVSQILNLTPVSAPHADSSRSAEGIAEAQADHPQLVRQRVIGKEQPETLTARANLAQRIGEAGDAVRARDLYAALLDAIKRGLSPDAPEAWTVRAELAHWTGEAGDAAGAREQYAALLADLERAHSNDPAIPTVRANHAWYTGLAGDAAGARDQYAALLADLERAHSNDPAIPTVRANRDYWAQAAKTS